MHVAFVSVPLCAFAVITTVAANRRHPSFLLRDVGSCVRGYPEARYVQALQFFPASKVIADALLLFGV